MTTIGYIQGFPVTFDVKTNKGEISDNGFTISFEYDEVNNQLICSDEMDDMIYSELLELLKEFKIYNEDRV